MVSELDLQGRLCQSLRTGHIEAVVYRTEVSFCGIPRKPKLSAPRVTLWARWPLSHQSRLLSWGWHIEELNIVPMSWYTYVSRKNKTTELMRQVFVVGIYSPYPRPFSAYELVSLKRRQLQINCLFRQTPSLVERFFHDLPHLANVYLSKVHPSSPIKPNKTNMRMVWSALHPKWSYTHDSCAVSR